MSGDEWPLFGVRLMARRADPETSHEAAAVIEPQLNRIQAHVLEVFTKRGPMTARYAERLTEFREYGFSTVRKRISELNKMGKLAKCGVDRNQKAPATIYEVANTRERR